MSENVVDFPNSGMTERTIEVLRTGLSELYAGFREMDAEDRARAMCAGMIWELGCIYDLPQRREVIKDILGILFETATTP